MKRSGGYFYILIVMSLLMGGLTASSALGQTTEGDSRRVLMYELDWSAISAGQGQMVKTASEEQESDSLDGKQVAHSRYRYDFGTGRWSWDILLSQGTNAGAVVSMTTSEIDPSLHPTQKKLVFVSNRDGNLNIFSINEDKTGFRRLTSNSADDGEPVYSPDGTRIAFTTKRHGQADIYTMNGDGSSLLRLTSDPAYDGQPSWSPDGLYLLFTSNRSGGYRIYRMKSDGSSVEQLTAQPYSGHAFYSPDSHLIAYDCDGDNDGQQEVWIMNADGSDQREWYDLDEPYIDYTAGSWGSRWNYVAVTFYHWVLIDGKWYFDNYYTNEHETSTLKLIDYNASWGMDPSFRSDDNIPPQLVIPPLPPTSPYNVKFHWTCTDNVRCNLTYLYLRDGPTGNWQKIPTSYSYVNDLYGEFEGQGGHTYYILVRMEDDTGNVSAWPTAGYDLVTTIENLPPVTKIKPLPPQNIGKYFDVEWDVPQDPGGSGLSGYTFYIYDQVTEVLETIWRLIGDNRIPFSPLDYRDLCFTIVAVDKAGNMVPKDPIKNPDTCTSLVSWMQQGVIRNQVGAPIPRVEPLDPLALKKITPSASDGGYLATGSIDSQSSSLGWQKPGYGILPSSNLLVEIGENRQLDYFMPPLGNFVQNSRFEEGPAGLDGWVASGPVFPSVSDDRTHSPALNLPSMATMFAPINLPETHQEGKFALLRNQDRSLEAVWIGVDNQIYHAARSETGIWGTVHQLTQAAVGSSNPAIVRTAGGPLAVFFLNVEGTIFGARWTIYYIAQDNQGNWQDMVKTGMDSSYTFLRGFRAAAAPDGTLHIVAESYGQYNHTYLPPSGEWTNTELRYSSNPAINLDLLCDNQSRLHFTSDQPALYHSYQIWTAAEGWQTASVSLPPGAEPELLFQPRIVMDDLGRVHLVGLVFLPDDLFWSVRHPAYARMAPDGSFALEMISTETVSSVGVMVDHDLEVWVAGFLDKPGEADFQLPHIWRETPQGWQSLGGFNTGFRIGTYLYNLAILPLERGVAVFWDETSLGGKTNLLVCSTVLGNAGCLPIRKADFENISLRQDNNLLTIGNSEFVPPTPESATLSQVIQVPDTDSTLVLSFDYKGQGFTTGGLFLKMESDTLTRTVNLDSTESWQHKWFNLSDFSGQTITITLAVSDESALLFDNLFVAPSAPDLMITMKPVQTAGIQPGSTVLVDVQVVNLGPVAITDVVLTVDLPGGSQDIDVGNLPALQGDPKDAVAVTLKVPVTIPLLRTRPYQLPVRMSVSGAETEMEVDNNSAVTQLGIVGYLYVPLIRR